MTENDGLADVGVATENILLGWVDPDSAIYVAEQRAFRAGLAVGDITMAAGLMSSWLDGFMTGVQFNRPDLLKDGEDEPSGP